MNKYLEALDIPENNKYLDAIATEIPEVKPFQQTPVENANWTALKDVATNVPHMAVDIGERLVSGATMGLSDKVGQAGDWLSEKLTGVKSEQLPKNEDYIPPNKYVLGGAEFVGAAVPISAAGNILAKPIAKKLITIGEKYLTPAAARYMPALAKVLGWSATGTVYDTASKVIEEGKLPTVKEAATSGLMWGALETGIGTASWAGKTALAIRRFAKEAEIKPSLAIDIVFKLAKKEGRPLAEVANDKALYHGLKKIVIEMPESKIGEPLIMPKDYTGQGAEIPSDLKTTLHEAEPSLPEKEVPLRPDQRAVFDKRKIPESKIGEPLITPKNDMSAINAEQKNATQKQRSLQAELNKGLTGNKYLDSLDRESLREPPSSVPPDASKVPGQASSLTTSMADKPTSPVDATKDFLGKTGKDKAERTAGDFISDINTIFQGKGGLTIQDVALTEKQNAAIERVFEDAKKAGKDVSEYMKGLGLSSEAVASILERKKNVQVQIATSTPKEKVGDKIIETFAKDRSTIIKDVVKNIDNAIGIVSTRLGNIAPELKTKLRQHAFEAPMNIKRDLDKVKPWYNKFEKLSDKDKFELTLLLRNGQYDKESLKQAGKFMFDKKMSLEFKQWETVRNETLKRAKDSGMNINEIENYFPSHVRDYVGLRESLGKEAMGKIDEAIAKEAAKRNITVDELGDESKSAIADSMIRGWSKNKVFLFDPFEIKSGIGKSRTLKGLDRNLIQHYHDAGESMVKFVSNMNAAIANNNFFRKSRTVGKTIKAEGLDSVDLPMNTREVNASIGDIITDLKKNKNLTMEQEAEIRNVITSYMMPKSQGKFVTGIKNLTYGAVLGNPITALTQVQDVGITISRQGLRNTLQGFGKMFSKNAIKLGDIGIDNWAADFERQTKMGRINKIAMAPLTVMDIFGKKLNMNANLARTQRALRKGSPEINAEIDSLFGDPAIASQVKDDLLAGRKTFDTNFYMFDNLSKYHPISKAEVPTGYLNSNKGRLLYMLHTYQIKQLDILRNDVLNEFKKGNIKKGAYNMASLTTFIVGAGMGVNAARDFITKGETKGIDEYLIDNIGQMFLVNRYLFDKGFRDGIGSLLWDGVKPATLSIANDLSKDLKDIVEGNEEKGLRSTKYIPLVGRPYYDKYGRGYENSLERNQ